MAREIYKSLTNDFGGELYLPSSHALRHKMGAQVFDNIQP